MGEASGCTGSNEVQMQVDRTRRQANAGAASAATNNNSCSRFATKKGLTSVLFELLNRGVEIQQSKNVPSIAWERKGDIVAARLRSKEWVARGLAK